MAITRVKVHGTAVQIENETVEITQRRDAVPEWRINRTGFGTVVRKRTPHQGENDGTWFHFPVATPTKLEDDEQTIDRIHLRLNVGDGVDVLEVTYHTGAERFVAATRPAIAHGSVQSNEFDVRNQSASDAVDIAVKLHWHLANAEVTFVSAGVKFID